jgi:uncharacterized protein (DUF427 family)
VKAVFNGQVIAESDDLVEVEGNQYFPRAALKDEFLIASDHSSHCGWKGDASYWTVEVDGERAENAVWTYEEPMEGAEVVADRVAFWKGVTVED